MIDRPCAGSEAVATLLTRRRTFCGRCPVRCGPAGVRSGRPARRCPPGPPSWLPRRHPGFPGPVILASPARSSGLPGPPSWLPCPAAQPARRRLRAPCPTVSSSALFRAASLPCGSPARAARPQRGAPAAAAGRLGAGGKDFWRPGTNPEVPALSTPSGCFIHSLWMNSGLPVDVGRGAGFRSARRAEGRGTCSERGQLGKTTRTWRIPATHDLRRVGSRR